jgi:hypothetical protein
MGGDSSAVIATLPQSGLLETSVIAISGILNATVIFFSTLFPN